MKLTNTSCKNAKPKDKPYKIFDGGGLFLLVKPGGSKLWRLKYRYLGKEKLMALGAYPATSLSEAREQRESAKKLLASVPPIDPLAQKKDIISQATIVSENTFQAIALEWHKTKHNAWSKGYAEKTMRILEMDIFPFLGPLPIAEITAPKLLECLRNIENRNAFDIVNKARQIAGMVFRYGIQTGKCERDPAADLKGALQTYRTEHYASLDARRLPEFLQALERNEARIYERTRRAVWLSLLTFQRPGEIRQAEWSEIDFEEKEWRIHGSKMKMRRDHIVPLSEQSLFYLQEQKTETGHLNTNWVFPSQVRPKMPMSDGTVNKAIKRLGFGSEMVAHGFRALARTTIREKLSYDSEVIEKQLAHKTSNPLGEAYDRTQFLEERKNMMQDWADYLDSLSGDLKMRA